MCSCGLPKLHVSQVPLCDATHASHILQATLMRSLQSRLMKGEGDSMGPSPPGAATVLMPAGAAAAAAAGEEETHPLQQHVQQPQPAHEWQLQEAPLLDTACALQAGPPPAAAREVSGPGGMTSSASPPAPVPQASSLSSMMTSPGCQRSCSPQPEQQRGQQRGRSELGGGCADMAISPPGRL